tara:strand:+ start:366 stop:728 length:363 start_codon:yes stop_codon:yes gene_type:complete
MDLLSKNFTKKLGNIIDLYFTKYKIEKWPNIIDYKRVPSLKQICLKKIQDKNIYCKCNIMNTIKPLYSIYDTNNKIIEYFNNIKLKDKKKFLDYLVNIYLNVQEDLLSICDYRPTRLPTS